MGEQQYDWFFVDSNNQRNGPHTRDELLARWRAGDVRSSTMVWAPGMGAWSRFEEAFAEQLPPTPPAAAVPPPVEATTLRPVDRPLAAPAPIPAAWAQSQSDAPQANSAAAAPGRALISTGLHPWRRYFAKQCDVLLFSLVSMFGLMISLTVVSPEAAGRLGEGMNNQLVATMLSLFLWAILEWLCLTFVGTTPGRALYGIELRMVDGSKLSGATALSRAFLVGVKGMGLGIPLVALVTCIVGYNVLNKDGRSTWDAELGTRVTHIQWSPLRALSVVLVTTVLFFALVVLLAMEKSL